MKKKRLTFYSAPNQVNSDDVFIVSSDGIATRLYENFEALYHVDFGRKYSLAEITKLGGRQITRKMAVEITRDCHLPKTFN